MLHEAGFSYDSSILPTYHDRYGIPDSPKYPYKIELPNGKELIEFPLSTADILGFRLPVAGDGYFRLYPYYFSKPGFSQINKKGHPYFLYASLGNRSISAAYRCELVINISALK